MLKKAAALVLLGASLALVGCTTNINRYVYAAIPSSSQIVVYREDPNSGILTPLPGSPITAGPGVASIAIHPSKKYLYAANSTEGDISLYKISTGGGLTEVTPRAIAGVTPNLLLMDSTGGFLYVMNTGSNDISVFSISASTGALAPVPQGSSPTIGIGVTPLNMKLSPSGNVLYVTGSGQLGQPGNVEVFTLIAGVATYVPPAVPAGNGPYGLAIAPGGSFLYVANFADNSISSFSIGTGGALTSLGSPIGETFAAPLALLVDKSGKYLYVANENSTNLAAFAIGSDGGLTLLATSPFATGSQPSFIASDPTGSFLFVSNQSKPVIQSFSLDGSSGTLTSVASYGLANSATSIAVTP